MAREKLKSEVRQLYEHLAATRERPIEREASRWIGEADAITDDLVGPEIADLDLDVIQRRIGHVADLLSNIEGTGDSTADEHVESARDLANTILESNTK
jgi:hypothetical protein